VDTPDGIFSKKIRGDMVTPISTPFMNKKVVQGKKIGQIYDRTP
jgi:hypothetical protein